MGPGGRNHLVTIQEKRTWEDEYGNDVGTWAAIAADGSEESWVSIVPLAGREYNEAKLVAATHTHTIRGHWRDDVTPDNRLLYGSRVFNIVSVANIGERNRELELKCVEVV